jgi:hypothetical protein
MVLRRAFAQVGFSYLIQHLETVIPTGGTALFAVPERRNLSSTLDSRRNTADHWRYVLSPTYHGALTVKMRSLPCTSSSHSSSRPR